MTGTYEFLEMADGEKIRLGLFIPEKQPKGVIQLIHGFGEYIGHYLTVIDYFVSENFACVMHDQRGHGILAAESPKKRGVAENYQKFLDDALEVREIITQRFPNLPIYLMGHSMGGNIILNLLLKEPKNQQFYQKAIVESPWLDLAESPAKVIQILAKIGGKISPKLKVHTGLKLEAIAHDAELVKQVTKDGIYHDILSLRLFTQIKEAGEFAQENATALKIPTLLFCAERDGICSAPVIRNFAENVGDNLKFVEISDGYHALHLDTQAQQVLAQMRDFLEN